jgi:internalin A
LKKLWSLYLDNNKITDLAPIAGLTKIDSLDLSNNEITDIAPLAGFNQLKYLFLANNKIADLALLVEMTKKDFEGEKRFAPFCNVYLTGNPVVGDAAKGEQLAELKKYVRTIKLD